MPGLIATVGVQPGAGATCPLPSDAGQRCGTELAAAASCAGDVVCCIGCTLQQYFRRRPCHRPGGPAGARRCSAVARPCGYASQSVSVHRGTYSTWADRSSSSDRAGQETHRFSSVGVWAWPVQVGIRGFPPSLREQAGTWRLEAMQAKHRGIHPTGQWVIPDRVGPCQARDDRWLWCGCRA